MNKLKGILSNTVSFIKRFKKAFIVLVLVLLAVSYSLFFKDAPALAEETTEAVLGTVSQEVSVTGRVKSAQAVDLAFDRSGRVSGVFVSAGSRVGAGQTLAQLDSSELLAQRSRELAGVAVAGQRLEQAIASTRQVSGDSTVVDALSKSIKVVVDSMVDFSNIQYEYFNSSNSENNQIADSKAMVLEAIYGERDLGRTGAWYFTGLTGGLKAKISDAEINSDNVNSDELIAETKNAILLARNAMELIYVQATGEDSITSAELVTIKTDIDLLIGQLSVLTGQNKTVVSNSFEVEIARAQLSQAEANLALLDAQIAKNSLRAPFAGVVTSVEIDKGELAGSGPAVSLISSAKYEIEVNVSEADIAKIKIGNKADVTLDAYGSDQIFTAVVTHIDPAAKIIDGVASYKIVLQFEKQDERILPGLTADMEIKTQQKENILYVPSRDVIVMDGKKYVKVLITGEAADVRFANLQAVLEQKNQKIFEVEVQTGLRGSDGRTEVISGVKEGDLIVSE